MISILLLIADYILVWFRPRVMEYQNSYNISSLPWNNLVMAGNAVSLTLVAMAMDDN